METFTSVEAYNASLVAQGVSVDILDYLRTVARIEGMLDFAFAKELQELVHSRDCCIPHEYLVKYGVFTEKNASTHVREMLGQYAFVEGRDYVFSDVRENIGGGRPRRVYHLHPRAFKICLMRSKNTRKYADYYVLLEEAIVRYREYQLALEQKRRLDTEERNKALEAHLASWRAETKQDFAEVKTELKTIQHQNKGLEVKVDTLATTGHAAIDKLNEVAAHLADAAHDLAPPPVNDDKHENLAVIKIPGKAYGYRFACLNTAGLRREGAKMSRAEPEETILLTIRCVPNANSLYLRLVERLGTKIELLKTGGAAKKFRLKRGFTQSELLAEVRAEHEARKGDYQDVAHGAKAWGVVTKKTVETTVSTTVEFTPCRGLSDEDVDALMNDILG